MALDLLSRRRLLLSAVATASLAGCSGAPGGTTATGDAGDAAETSDTDDAASPDATASPGSVDGETTDEAAATDDAATDTSTPDHDATTADERTTAADGDLDLREANVVGIEFDSVGGGYRFDVTLYHDDDGESGYADWWQVETLDGDRLGRRELLHAHSTAPFTRSETVSIPDGTTHVVVRGHDQTHGYGGQAMVVGVDSGEAQRVRQGPEPRSFSSFEPSA
ncbi:hypothetical protein [Salinigranum marinum]|uniref:hypothetical protein n=1 Tax=Salinigranum marinum TaxID=1515595 RepID=UPI002989D37A|nr:hypothetical protein [Salinigranum marinum]